MKILVTGASGFAGKNLVAALKNIKDGKDKTRPELNIEEIYQYDVDSTEKELIDACENADFVFNFAGVNRPQNTDEFMKGNFGFASKLLETLKAKNNVCPVILSSSIQATLVGRYADGEYGKAKKRGRTCFLNMAKKREQRFLFIDSPIFLENGADQTITAQLQPFATILQMSFLYK